ncbi:APC family permease [Streptomyces scopuliridis]|uniref:APC family permease n=1 Tax=Streptomyces scopuliridis TaxID=452529 RepID=A0ACD4ZZG7_9ACTN|nr:APC family permease [Streptomyces scopuliridis]WSC03357.1 APC family permease [Streptomyces scopuliridis]WSC10767.1 APC family permease [Streptomyces scopuliridis]
MMLRLVGREWGRVSAAPDAWRRALPVDPDTGSYPEPAQIVPARFGRFVQVPALNAPPPGAVDGEIGAPLGRFGAFVRRVALGAPLKSTAIARERMRKLIALPVLSADALSSVAYGPEALLAVLVLGGTAGLAYSLPVALAIVFLMLAVGVSYRQTIRAYPYGGGSYIVATDNLGRVPGLVAAAGLMTDYVLTVAVSVSSGMAAVTSALPQLAGDTVLIGVLVIAVLLAGNLRGVRQAGALFAAPTYAFIIAVTALVAVGVYDAAGRDFQPVPTPPLHAVEGVGLLLVMRSFASGSTAMTGIEAISNAVPAFKPVSWRNARTTLSWMIGLLIALFAGTMAMVYLEGVIPQSQETVLSQLAHRSFGSGPMYVFTQAATALVLLLAANTAYNDFPRVLYLLARDNHAPRIFLRLGDRLAFSNGIIVLSVAAVCVYVAFDGKTASLIPLYAVGVFLAFTLSQSGMVMHWWRKRDRHWRKSLCFNATGALLSAVVFITAGITKFTEGAWLAILTVALFLLVTTRIRRHYDKVREALRLHPQTIEIPSRTITPQPCAEPPAGPEVPSVRMEDSETEETPEEIRHLSVVPVDALHQASMRTLAYAASLQQPVLVLHVSPSDEDAERFREAWLLWGDHLPLRIVISPYRATVAPLISYLESLHRQRPDLTITVILPEIVERHWWHRLLHSPLAGRLRRALRSLPKIVVTTVPFHV